MVYQHTMKQLFKCFCRRCLWAGYGLERCELEYGISVHQRSVRCRTRAALKLGRATCGQLTYTRGQWGVDNWVKWSVEHE